MVELLEEACVKMRDKFEYSRQEEDDLDVFEYLLRRTLVELNEIKKERDPSTQKWSDRVSYSYLLWATLVFFWSFQYALLSREICNVGLVLFR